MEELRRAEVCGCSYGGTMLYEDSTVYVSAGVGEKGPCGYVYMSAADLQVWCTAAELSYITGTDEQRQCVALEIVLRSLTPNAFSKLLQATYDTGIWAGRRQATEALHKVIHGTY